MKVREILTKKTSEGLSLHGLVFDYSLPSLKQELSVAPQNHAEDKRGLEGDIQPTDAVTDMEVGDIASVSQEVVTCGLDGEMQELTMLLDRIAAGSQRTGETPRKSISSDTSLFTVCDQWISRRKSHSTEKASGSIKQRNNPPRMKDSLTRRERDYLHKTEEDNLEDKMSKQEGFSRSYGKSGKSDKKQSIITSTPAPEVLTSKKVHGFDTVMVNRAQKHLLDYLGLDIGSPSIQRGLTKSKISCRKDTPLPKT